jgi:hypothetical protein
MKRTRRSGLWIRDKGGNAEVRRAVVRFARWLRQEFEFPVRVPVYLYSGPHIVTREGAVGTASFFAPWRRTVEPYIRIATGDYSSLKRAWGKDNALGSMLWSVAHEVLHYQTWVATGKVEERGVDRRALAVVKRYWRDVHRL